MNKKLQLVICVVVAAICISGCQSLKEKPADDTLITLRASFVNACPYGTYSDRAVEGLGGFIGADLITKGVTGLITFANDQLQKAAKEDSEAFTLTSSSPEYMLGINATTRKQGVQCLIIAAGPTKPGANICTSVPDESKLWGGSKSSWCGQAAAVTPLWSKWGFEDIHFVAQIELSMMKFGAPAFRIPQLKGIYYPKSLSGRPDNKIKGLVLEISAADATDPKNPQIFSVLMDGKGLVPGENSKMTTPLSDKWIVIAPQPKDQLTSNQLLSHPVNLKVTLSETPRPNWLLQKAAKLAADKEDDVAERLSKAAVQRWVPEEREKAARDEASADRASKLKVAGLCDAWYTKGQELEFAKAAKPIENPTSVTAAELDKKKRENAIQVAILNYAQAEADATAAWEDAGMNKPICSGAY